MYADKPDLKETSKKCQTEILMLFGLGGNNYLSGKHVISIDISCFLVNL